MANIKFDEGLAKELGTTVRGKIDELNAELERIKTTVEGCRNWWKGGSEEGFIRNFDTTKKEVSRQLQEWLNEYDKLINAAAAEKVEDEREGRRVLEQ